jgi:hypothetical protein
MENMPINRETDFTSLGRRNRKFGDKVIRKVSEEGASGAILNPILFGLAYRDEAVYNYIQAGLTEKGIVTHIDADLIESGSERQIPRHTLIVDSRPEK